MIGVKPARRNPRRTIVGAGDEVPRTPRPHRFPRRTEIRMWWIKSTRLRADSRVVGNESGVDGVDSQSIQKYMSGVKLGFRRSLSSPIVGFAPWIAFSVLEGPKRYALAVGVAFLIAVLQLVIGRLVGSNPKLLDVSAILFFLGMLAAGLLVGQGGQSWLDQWSGEVSNVMLVGIALLSIVAGSPFTIQYARDVTPEEYWKTPLFIHVNYVLTWVWAGSFAITAAVGWYGDGPLHQPDNIWTNWIIQIALLVFAIRFTEWYPDVAAAHALPATDQSGGATPNSIAGLLVPMATLLIPTGIVIMAFDAAPTWTGIGLIVVGGLLTRLLHDEASGDLPSDDATDAISRSAPT